MTPGMRSLQQQLFLRMRQPRLIGPNNVLLAYPRNLPSLRVDVKPHIEHSKTVDKAEQRKRALPVQKFHQAWRRAIELETLGETDEQGGAESRQAQVPDHGPQTSESSEPKAASSATQGEQRSEHSDDDLAEDTEPRPRPADMHA